MLLKTTVSNAESFRTATVDEEVAATYVRGAVLPLMFSRDGEWDFNGRPAGELPTCWLQWQRKALDRLIARIDQKPLFIEAADNPNVVNLVGSITAPRLNGSVAICFDVRCVGTESAKRLLSAVKEQRSVGIKMRVGLETPASPDKSSEHQAAESFYDVAKVEVTL